MCDYSLMHLKSRPAVVGDKLITKQSASGTTGFFSPDDTTTAVCCLPGTEIAFDEHPVGGWSSLLFAKPWKAKYKVAVFRQINKDEPYKHHDALEFPNGEIKLLTQLAVDAKAVVLQLPAAPKTQAEAQEQERLEVVA